MNMFTLLAIISLVAVASHSHPYNSIIKHTAHPREVFLAGKNEPNLANLFVAPQPGQSSVDFHPMLKEIPGPNDPIVYYSWHIHTYFFHENKNVTDRALSLRQDFMKHFQITNCTGDCFMGGWMDTVSIHTYNIYTYRCIPNIFC